MALYPCPDCKREISTDAKACPHCGKRAGWAATQARWKAMPKGVQYFVIGAACFFILAMIISNSPEKQTPTSAAAPPVQEAKAATATASPKAPDGRMTVQPGNWFAFRDRDAMDRATQFLVQKDKDAWSTFMAQEMVSGQCIQLKPGEQVYLDDTAMFSGKVKIRRKGETSGWWTNFEAVKQ